MELFREDSQQLSGGNFFLSKKLHRRCSCGFLICLWSYFVILTYWRPVLPSNKNQSTDWWNKSIGLLGRRSRHQWTCSTAKTALVTGNRIAETPTSAARESFLYLLGYTGMMIFINLFLVWRRSVCLDLRNLFHSNWKPWFLEGMIFSICCQWTWKDIAYPKPKEWTSFKIDSFSVYQKEKMFIFQSLPLFWGSSGAAK